MATENRLRAHIQDSHIESIRDIADARDIAETEAERLVVREGLESLGYVERPDDPAELMLYYLRQIGVLLGFVGLICMGYGAFGPRSWSVIGFGLLVMGFLIVALGEGLDWFTAWSSTAPAVEQAKDHA